MVWQEFKIESDSQYTISFTTEMGTSWLRAFGSFGTNAV